MPAWSFPASRIVHRLAVKLRAVVRRTSAALGHRTAISMAIIQSMIHMTVKMFRPVIPGSRADKDSIGEPFRRIIPVGSAIVRRYFVITVRANGRSADTYRNVRGTASRSQNRQREKQPYWIPHTG